jgi:opacity protein-like surface antigen
MTRFKLLLLLAGLSVHSLYGGDYKGASDLPSVVSVEDSGGLYVGIGAGLFALRTDPTREKLSSVTGTAIFGYALNRYIALEARLHKSLGHLRYHRGKLTIPDQTLKSTYDSQALFVKVGYGMGAFEPYVLLGYGRSRITDLSYSDRIEWSKRYGAGIGYRVSEHVEVFADYVRAYRAKGFDGRSTQETVTLDHATLGLRYHF